MTENIADPGIWDRELELQKTRGMSPKEARVYTLVEDMKMTVKDVAEIDGVSTSTIKSLLARAREKMKDSGTTITFVIPPLPANDSARPYKTCAIKKILYLMELGMGCKVHFGKTMMVRVPEDSVGDTAWLKANVFAYIPPLNGLFEGETECREKAQKMYDRIASLNSIDKIGWGALKYQLEQCLAPYDLFEE